MPPMTQARTRAIEVGSPSLRQLSLAAMLRAFVELVLHAASTLRMRWRCLSRDWHTDDAATALPEATSGNQYQGSSSPATQGSSALILRDREAIVSKDEGVLTTVSHTLAHPWGPSSLLRVRRCASNSRRKPGPSAATGMLAKPNARARRPGSRLSPGRAGIDLCAHSRPPKRRAQIPNQKPAQQR